jgi:hypothetical protein
MPTTVIGPPEGMAYILAQLQAASALLAYLPAGANGIFRTNATQAAINNPPFIRINYQGGADVLGATATRIMASGLYQVAIYGPDTQFATLLAAAKLLDAALQETSGTAVGATILTCHREQAIMLSEIVSGSDQQWTRIGGLYRILVS